MAFGLLDFGNQTGGGLLDAMFTSDPSKLTPDQRQAAGNAWNMIGQMGLGILANNQPGVSFGEAIGRGGLMGMQSATQMQQAQQMGQLRNLQIAQAKQDLERRKRLVAMFPGAAPPTGAPGMQVASGDPSVALTPAPGERPGPTPQAAGRLSGATAGSVAAMPPQLAQLISVMEPDQAAQAMFQLQTNQLKTDQWVDVGGGLQRNARTGETKPISPKLVDVAVNPRINMPPQETKFQESYGRQLGEQAAKIHEAADSARTQVQRLQQLEGLMSDVETGKLAPFRASVGAWAQDLGISDESLQRFGIKPTDPINAQAITAVTNALTVGMIGPGGFPANNFSDADRKFLQQTMPQLSNTPGGNRIIAQAMRRAAERNISKEDAWLVAQDQGKSYTQFLREWNKFVKDTPLFPKVASPEQLAQLPSGTVFTAPDGSVRVKP